MKAFKKILSITTCTLVLQTAAHASQTSAPTTSNAGTYMAVAGLSAVALGGAYWLWKSPNKHARKFRDCIKRFGCTVYAATGGAIGRADLHWAARNGYAKTVRILLEQGISHSTAGTTALHEAAQSGHATVVCALLEHGSDVNATIIDRPQFPTHASTNPQHIPGTRALHLAARFGHDNVLQLLVEQGNADIGVLNHSGMTPLHEAAAKGHPQIVKTLIIKYGAPADSTRYCGFDGTALHRERPQ